MLVDRPGSVMVESVEGRKMISFARTMGNVRRVSMASLESYAMISTVEDGLFRLPVKKDSEIVSCCPAAGKETKSICRGSTWEWKA